MNQDSEGPSESNNGNEDGLTHRACFAAQQLNEARLEGKEEGKFISSEELADLVS